MTLLIQEMEYNGTRYDISTFNLPDWRGAPRSTCYILRDISDRIKLERKLETLHLYATRISNAQSMDEIGVITSNALSNSLGFEKGMLCMIEDYQIYYNKLWGVREEQFQALVGKELVIENMVGIHKPHIYVSVDDTSKLFKPFHTTKINGMGLGLVSVKHTVEKHGGTIDVESEKGVGTEFIIRIPEDAGHMGMSETRLNSISIT